MAIVNYNANRSDLKSFEPQQNKCVDTEVIEDKVIGDISDMTYKNVEFINCSFESASVYNCKFKNCNFDKCNFQMSNILGSDFDDCLFRDCNSGSGMRLQDNSFNNCIFNGCTLRNAVLMVTRMYDCSGYQTDLDMVRMKSCQFVSLSMRECRSIDVQDDGCKKLNVEFF